MAEATTIKRSEVRPIRAPGWRLWLSWVLASTAAFAAGGLGGTAVSRLGGIIVAGYVAVTLGWIASGALQWLVLLRQGVRAGRWVPATLGAAAIVGVVVFGVGMVSPDVGWVLGASVFGTLAGVLQWLALRFQVARAGWWVLASTFGWVVGMPVGGALGWAALGATYGAITGFAVVRLLHRTQKGDSP